ncbi:MAG: thiamine pyrophosphate-dependent dehydrogenase E1 component subunit alpha [Phycisphaerae bacterium]|nr:thiamine pyrophosphate-dependent dehydrogenase E1 component subunit alpha [Phycisphaerae bacterium]
MPIKKDRLKWIYERMCLIRKFEDHVHDEFAAGAIAGFVHLYAGEEAIAVGTMANLRDDDSITSTHRGHGHCIAKGVDINAMLAEIYGKATGACKGKGGSMHIADMTKGMLGANGIVGAGPPLACGAALAAKLRGTDQVTACFFGDGASNQGTFHESLNLASIWDLPIVFVAENNVYAETTSTDYSMRVPNIADRAVAYGIPGVVVDGMDVFAVYDAAAEAVARARKGKGPTLLEGKTYRYYGHFEGDTILYRTKQEEQSYKDRDPILQFHKRVLEEGLLSEDQLAKIDQQTDTTLKKAKIFAAASPFPEPQECLEDVYVKYP